MASEKKLVRDVVIEDLVETLTGESPRCIACKNDSCRKNNNCDPDIDYTELSIYLAQKVFEHLTPDAKKKVLKEWGE